jgi:hypothetical protein
LPAGVHAGQKIHVQAPDGGVNEIMVPDGFGPGSTFTVEFAESEKEVSVPSQSTYPTAPATATATANSYGNDGDDGFATGFHNPNFVPTPTAPASSYGNDHYTNDLSAYPSASDAKPVYSSTPAYPASTY